MFPRHLHTLQHNRYSLWLKIGRLLGLHNLDHRYQHKFQVNYYLLILHKVKHIMCIMS